MYVTRHLVPSTCTETCPFLSTVSAPAGTDSPLPPTHFPCAWRAFAKRARRLVIDALHCLPLRTLAVRLSASTPYCRSAESVREELVTDADLINDLTQEVACAMHEATLRGKLSAARPAIDGWLQVVVPRIVRRHARGSALLTFLAPLPFAAGDEAEESQDPCEARAGIDGARLSHAPPLDPERRRFERLVRDEPERLSRLTSGQRAAFELWVAGDTGPEIAGQLGATQLAVRLRLMHAKRRLAA